MNTYPYITERHLVPNVTVLGDCRDTVLASLPDGWDDNERYPLSYPEALALLVAVGIVLPSLTDDAWRRFGRGATKRADGTHYPSCGCAGCDNERYPDPSYDAATDTWECAGCGKRMPYAIAERSHIVSARIIADERARLGLQVQSVGHPAVWRRRCSPCHKAISDARALVVLPFEG